jgi:enoyl-CoA hydratase/carnithine racemase
MVATVLTPVTVLTGFLGAGKTTLLARMLQLSPQAARLNKQVLRQRPPIQEPTPTSAYAYAASPEHREGVQAFLDKRRPEF